MDLLESFCVSRKFASLAEARRIVVRGGCYVSDPKNAMLRFRLHAGSIPTGTRRTQVGFGCAKRPEESFPQRRRDAKLVLLLCGFGKTLYTKQYRIVTGKEIYNSN